MAAKDSLDIDGDPFKLVGDKKLKGKEIRLQLIANVPTPEAAAKALVGANTDLALASFARSESVTHWRRAAPLTGVPSSPNPQMPKFLALRE